MSYSETICKADSHVYYNATIYNNTAFPQIAEFKEIRKDLFLDHSEKYKMAVVSFTVPNTLQPIFYWPSTATNVPDNEFYKVVLEYNNVKYPAFLVFEPQIPLSQSTPVAGSFLGVYSYEAMAKMINTAFLKAFVLLTTANPALKPLLKFPPYFVYNREFSCYDLYVSDSTAGYVNSSIATVFNTVTLQNEYVTTVPPLTGTPLFDTLTTTRIALSATLYTLLKNFRIFQTDFNSNGLAYIYVNKTGAETAILYPPMIAQWESGITYGIGDYVQYGALFFKSLTSPNLGNVPPTSPANWVGIANDELAGVVMKGETSSIQNMQGLRSVRICTSLIPSRSELMGLTINGGEDAGIANSDTRFILGDLEPEISTQSSHPVRGYIQYKPTAQYRYCDLMDNRNLRVIDLQVTWMDYRQVERPIYIESGESATIKLQFVRMS